MYLKKHYVYAYFDEQDQPYYIGKGIGGRAYSNHGQLPVPHKNKIKKLFENITDREACAIEDDLILKYGRKDLGTGILLNRRDATTPLSLKTRQKMSIQTKIRHRNTDFIKKHSNAVKRKWEDSSYRNKIYLATSTEDYKQKMRSIRKKINKDPLFKKNHSDSLKRKWEDINYKNKILSTRNLKRYKQNLKEKAIRRFQDPDFKKLHSESMKRHWQLRKNRERDLIALSDV